MEGVAQQEQRAQQLARKMGDWAASKGIADALRAMYSSVVVSRPDEPIQFLIDTLAKPDGRDDAEKEALLQEIFDLVAKERSGNISAAEAVVIVRESSAIVGRFPLHARAVGESLAASPANWGAFRDAALASLARPAVVV